MNRHVCFSLILSCFLVSYQRIVCLHPQVFSLFVIMDEWHITMQTLWDAIQKIKTDMLAHFDEKSDSIHSSLSRIQNSLSTLGDEVNLLEQRVGANEDNVQVCVILGFNR